MYRALLASALFAVVLVGCGQRTTHVSPIDLKAEIARARSENKLLVLEFTGSDWCPGCIVFEKQVLSQPEFTAYAQSNLVWVTVDFPEKVKLPPATEATNEWLRAQFDVNPLPTFIALDRDGREIWRLPAKDDPDPSLTVVPKLFIEQLEAVRRKNG
jgi:protein disulfide-isomerase